MARYTVARRYSSYRDGRQFGPWVGGEVVELDDADAQWLDRDSPGLLTPERAPVERAAKPAADRQHKGGRNRGA